MDYKHIILQSVYWNYSIVFLWKLMHAWIMILKSHILEMLYRFSLHLIFITYQICVCVCMCVQLHFQMIHDRRYDITSKAAICVTLLPYRCKRKSHVCYLCFSSLCKAWKSCSIIGEPEEVPGSWFLTDPGLAVMAVKE